MLHFASSNPKLDLEFNKEKNIEVMNENKTTEDSSN